MGDCLKAALEYASKYHWAVFPVSPNTKKPLTPHGCKDAKKTPGAIKAWWKKWPDASVGIATGSASNLVVIDEDLDEERGIDGIRSVEDWQRLHDKLPETVMAITGRGGYHLYYHYEGADIKNRAGLLEGVDVRGEGGYVIAPPSVHPNGTEYQWEYDPEEFAVAEINNTVLALLNADKEAHEAESFTLPERIGKGERNDTIYRLACSMQSQGYPDAVIEVTVRKSNLELCEPPLPEKEVDTILSSALRYKKGEFKLIKTAEEWHEPKLTMQLDKEGNPTDRPAQTIANAEEAITYDKELFGRIRYNELAYVPYVYGTVPWKTGKQWREWTNTDDSNLRSYIEKKYGIKSGEKVMDALANVTARFPFNPVKDLLEDCFERWDGNKHIENLLPSLLGVEKTDYTCAVMRLFMLGAIMRIYHPGCKFDYMLVLVGGQGGGKSTFLRLLALDDSWFNDNFSTLDSARAVENLRGMWIVEMAELQATKRAKDVETIKSFITSRVDTYRAPYQRRTEQRPRMCVLAGTSNPVDFLTDPTGNRRFLPITCDRDKATVDIFGDELAIKAEFAQAWGEAMDLYKHSNGKIRLTLPKRLEADAVAAQTHYLEENPYIGMVQAWLDRTDIDRVCVMMLWRDALEHKYDDPTRKAINELHNIMRNNIAGWTYNGKQFVNDQYGIQRCYDRINKGQFVEVNADEVSFFADVDA